MDFWLKHGATWTSILGVDLEILVSILKGEGEGGGEGVLLIKT